MTIEIVRTSFFHKHPKTLAYEEHSPGRVCEAHSICGCTDMVKDRPEGDPESVQQQVIFKGIHQGLEAEVRLTDPTLWSVFRWDRRPEDESLRVDQFRKPDERDHAYFIFGPDRVRIELAMPGYGYVDYFFGNIFLGNKVDFSTLYNGHSPSKIVDDSKVSADAVWVHGCSWGREAMRVLQSSEAQDWQSWSRVAKDILAQTPSSLTEDVHELRAALEASGVEKLVVGLQEHLVGLLLDFRWTETFRLCNEIAEKVKP